MRPSNGPDMKPVSSEHAALPPNMPVNISPELINYYMANPDKVPDAYRHLLPANTYNGAQQPVPQQSAPQQSERQPPAPQADVQDVRPSAQIPSSQPEDQIQTTARASEEEDRYAAYIPEGYRLPEKYRGRFPKGYEHLIGQYLEKDNDEDGGNGGEEGSQRRKRSAQRPQSAYGRQGGSAAQPQYQPVGSYYPQYQPQQGYQGFQNSNGHPLNSLAAQSGVQAAPSAALASINPLFLAELLHGNPDLVSLRQLAKMMGKDHKEIPTRDDLQLLLDSFDKKELKKYAKYADFEPTEPKYVKDASGAVSSSIQLVLSPLNHGKVYSCVAEHPTFKGQSYSKNMLFAVVDKKMADSDGKFFHTAIITLLN